MAIVDFKQRSPEWLEWRRTGITASMIPVIMGNSPYMTPYQLWAEFVGLKKPDDLSNNWHVQRGVEQEPEALDLIQSLYGKLFMPCCIESDENTLFKASLDGLSIDGTNEVVEIKCPCKSIYEEIISQQTNSKSFKMYYGQVQWQMFVAGTDKAKMFFYLRGQQPIQIAIKRNENYINEAKNKAIEFWALIQNNIQPELTIQDTVIYNVEDSQSKEWIETANKYIELEKLIETKKAEIADTTKQLNDLKEKLITFIPDNCNSVKKGGIKVTRSERQGRIDLDAVERHLVDKNILVSMDDFRKEPTTSYRISTYDNSTVATDVQPEQQVEAEPQNETTTDVQPEQQVASIQTCETFSKVKSESFFTDQSIQPIENTKISNFNVDSKACNNDQLSTQHKQRTIVNVEQQTNSTFIKKVEAFNFF